ncbi:MAG: hypothetical protein ACR2F1_06715 [Nitrososphaeraceae archaeon]
MQMLLRGRGTGETNLISIALQYLKQIPCLIIKLIGEFSGLLDETDQRLGCFTPLEKQILNSLI